MFEASRLSEISTSTIRRMFEIVAKAKRDGIDVINLSIGEPDFNTHPLLIEKAKTAMMEGYTHYTSNFGIDELRVLIAERYGIERENVMVTAGASEALLNASLAFIEDGSKILIPSPGFLSYFTYGKICRAKIVQIHTHETGFEVNPDLLNEKMDRSVSVIFLNYPNNPTGAVMQNLRAIAEIAQDNDAIVVSDEIYDSIYYDRKPETLAGYENTVVINGFSKSLAMTGWRVGYVIASPDLLDSMLKIHQVNGVCAPAFAQKAIAELMETGEDRKITEEMVAEFRKRRNYVYSRLTDMGLRAVKPEGAFYVFPEVPINSVEFCERLIEYGVAVTPGTAFGDGNENYIRISYAASMNMLEKAMEKLNNFISALN